MRRFLTGLFLLLPWFIVTAQDNNSISRLSFEYYNSQEYDKAAPLFLKMYEDNKVRTYLDYYVRCLTELKDYETAIDVLRKAIRKTDDPALYVSLGDIYTEIKDTRKAEEAYNEPFKNFPQTLQGINSLGSAYSARLKPEYAEMVYTLGRKVLGNPDEFRMELANVYYTQRRYSDMLEEYFAVLLTNPQYLPTVFAYLESALSHDIDGNLLEMIRGKTYASIQEMPGFPVYYEILIWVLSEEKKYDEAVDQAIALDRRTQLYGDKVLQIARTATEAGFLDASLKAYRYLIDRGPVEAKANPAGRTIQGQTPYRSARTEYLLTLSEKTQEEKGASPETWKTLTQEFRRTVDEFAASPDVVQQIILELARIYAYRLGDYSSALGVIEEALKIQPMQPAFRSSCLMEKGDILLASGDPWEPALVYSMIEIENPDNPAGSLAKLRKAQLSWFTGNFNWALAQLDILKGSTSKPIANDAFELSVLIRDNISDTDSTQSVLKALARADYLIFRHRYDEALALVDSIITASPDQPVVDDCLYKKAHILLESGQLDQAMEALKKIDEQFRYEFWGHKAVYELGCIYQDQLHDPDKARELFEGFLRDFPNSFYFLDVRNRLKTLREAKLTATGNPH